MTAGADSFSRNVMISMAGHVLVVALIMFRAVMAPNEPVILRQAIRVDVVGLPQKMPEPAAPPAPEKPAPVAAPTPVPKPVEKVLPKKVEPIVDLSAKKKEAELKKKQADALRNMERSEREADALKKLEAASKAKPKPTHIAGNQKSEGSASEELDGAHADEYYNVLHDSVLSHFSLPQYLADAGYTGQLRILVDDRGYVLRKIWVKHSGNDVFDAKMEEAIDSVQPFPAPPAGLRRSLSSAGVTLGFPQ